MVFIQIIKLLRPKHWIKNFLVFVPLFFSFSFREASVAKALEAFITYSLFASSVYIINDIFDAEKDRHHPDKKNRPIASGKVDVWQAIIAFLLITTVAFLIGLKINDRFLIVAIIYFVLNIFYSFGLKNKAIIDVMVIAFGFVLRVIAGSYAIGVTISHWLLLCTFFISLFFAFGKRKTEMSILEGDNKKNHRKSIMEYTDGFINQMLALSAGISVVFYSLYTIDQETVARFGGDNLIYTTPVVVYGILRYFHLLYNKKMGGDPVQIFLKDKQMIGCIILWVLMIIFIYFKYPKIEVGL